jgi:hypothetical protein
MNLHTTPAAVILGVDPARGGADDTVIAVLQGRDVIAIRRLSELVGQGLCRRLETRQEMTPSGRMGSVWETTT